MIARMMSPDTGQRSPVPQEGDLFKVIESHGKTFEIRYGFYEERDRYNQYAEPMAIYPNFEEHPTFTDAGVPFVTAMQNPCEHFAGTRDDNSSCEDCAFYRHSEELLGTCVCPNRRQDKDQQENVSLGGYER